MRLSKEPMQYTGNREMLSIEVVYLSLNGQAVIELNVPENTNLLEAIHLSKLLEKFPEIDLNQNKIGIFGKIASLETILQEGDRVEIYRPLLIDPKQKRLLKVKTCSKSRSSSIG